MTDLNSLFSNLNFREAGLKNMVGAFASAQDTLRGYPRAGMQDDRLHFKVAEFSMGSMAPKSDAYYEVSRVLEWFLG